MNSEQLEAERVDCPQCGTSCLRYIKDLYSGDIFRNYVPIKPPKFEASNADIDRAVDVYVKNLYYKLERSRWHALKAVIEDIAAHSQPSDSIKALNSLGDHLREIAKGRNDRPGQPTAPREVSDEVVSKPSAMSEMFDRWYETRFKPAMERSSFDKYVARQAWFAALQSIEPAQPSLNIQAPAWPGWPGPAPEGWVKMCGQIGRDGGHYERLSLPSVPVDELERILRVEQQDVAALTKDIKKLIAEYYAKDNV